MILFSYLVLSSFYKYLFYILGLRAVFVVDTWTYGPNRGKQERGRGPQTNHHSLSQDEGDGVTTVHIFTQSFTCFLPSCTTSPQLTSPHLTSPHLTSPHLTSPHLTSPHLTSPHLTSPHLYFLSSLFSFYSTYFWIMILLAHRFHRRWPKRRSVCWITCCVVGALSRLVSVFMFHKMRNEKWEMRNKK